ncbi:unnamed protein product, partial [Didymodactylos carnosus]
ILTMYVCLDGETDVEEDDNWEVLNVGDQAFGIKTSGLEEKSSACSMLVGYARELKEGSDNYVEETTKLMIPLLRFYFHEAAEGGEKGLDYKAPGKAL